MNVRVMVVDDDEELREVLCEALVEEGYEAIEAGDGEQALAKLKQQSADIILLDLMMPKMNGWELRAAMNRDPALATIPVVVMTAAASYLNGRDELAADAYLHKPVALSALLDTLESVRPR
jgi:CheY-like chemotaxis protein